MKFRLFILAAAIALSACSKAVHTDHAPSKPAYSVISVVHFATRSAALDRTARSILSNAAATLEKDTALTVEVAGHADSRNTDAFNMALAQRRAASVQKYLVKKGINANRLSIKSYGESQPVASNDTKAGMAKNRRAELRTR
ncbi:MAG: OmpA family protein [Mariprofundus sp.]